jgi:CBS domain containing-hemolysin-like protein
VVAATTYLSLIAGELVPKQIALGDPERVAAFAAPPMAALARLAAIAVRRTPGQDRRQGRAEGSPA